MNQPRLGGARQRGAVSTPDALARRLVAPVLERARRGGRLLDPACGDGALLAVAAELGRPELELWGLEIDEERAARARDRLGARARIRCVDALACRWPGASHVVANPPWVSFSGRGAAADRRPSDRSPAGRGWPSLHGAFVERIAVHVAEHGTSAAVLLPASVAALDGYAPLRARVDAGARLVELVELGERAFPGVTEPSILIRFEPRAGSCESRVAWTRHDREDEAWMARLRHFPRLPECTFADPGVHTGNAARELVRRPAGSLPGVREGRCLTAFRLAPPAAGLVTTLERTPERHFRIAPREHYAAFLVLLRQTADRPIAAVHREPTYFRNSLLGMRRVPGLAPECAAALLNGPVAAAWHRARFRDARQARFPQVKVGHLATQPFPLVRRDDDPELHDRLARTAERLASRPGTDALRDAELVRLVLGAFGLEGLLAERVLALAA